MPSVPASDGVPLHYEIHGARPIEVILLHGMGGSTLLAPMLEHIDRAPCA